jgi:hypothetical protein
MNFPKTSPFLDNYFTERDVVVKVLAHLGLPTAVLDFAPARAPPRTFLFADDDLPAA